MLLKDGYVIMSKIFVLFQIANVYCKQNRVERDRVLARGGEGERERRKHVSREVATK